MTANDDMGCGNGMGANNDMGYGMAWEPIMTWGMGWHGSQ